MSKRYTRFIHAFIKVFSCPSMTIMVIDMEWNKTLLTIRPKGRLVGFIAGLPTAVGFGAMPERWWIVSAIEVAQKTTSSPSIPFYF